MAQQNHLLSLLTIHCVHLVCQKRSAAAVNAEQRLIAGCCSTRHGWGKLIAHCYRMGVGAHSHFLYFSGNPGRGTCSLPCLGGSILGILGPFTSFLGGGSKLSKIAAGAVGKKIVREGQAFPPREQHAFNELSCLLGCLSFTDGTSGQ